MSRNEAPGTAKKGLFRIVFSRTGIILLLLLLQIWLFAWSSIYLEEYLFQTDWVELSVNVNTPKELELARSYFDSGPCRVPGGTSTQV